LSAQVYCHHSVSLYHYPDSSAMDKIAMLVKEYNSIEQQLAPMQNSESQMHNIDGQVASASSEISRRQTLLGQTQQDDAHMQVRVHRNENPRFLHYFVCNRDAKVERLKGELQQLQTNGQDLTNKLATDSQNLAALQQQKQNAHAIVDKKHQMEGQCRQLFNQVVDCQPPTQTLQQLRAGEQQQRPLLQSEQHLLQAVGTSVQHVQQGLALFQQAEGLYRHAQSTNEQAKNVTRMEANTERRERIDEAFGDRADAQNAEMHRRNLEMQERQLQARRDNEINQANGVAMQAYQVISTGMASFPAEARARYPQLCASIGQVAFPRVQGANFGSALMADAIFGTFGAAMNDMTSGCQIQDNMRTVGQCASMTSQQLGLMQSMQNAVSTNVHNLQASIRTLEQNITTERNNMFNGVRSAVMAASPA